MNAKSSERPIAVVGNPPHIVIAPSREQLVAGAGEEFATTALPDVVNHRRWHDLLAVVAAILPNHFTESRQVAEREIQPACSGFQCRPNPQENTRPAPHQADSRTAPAAAGKVTFR